MKSTDLFKRWTIVRNIESNIRCYFYGSYEEFLEETCTEDEKHLWEEVAFDNWTSNDLAEIFGSELEDANNHSWTWLPTVLLAYLKNNNVPEKECFNIITGIYMNWLTY